jgi:high-affinity K+ transport system ATPase subunit B
MSMESPSDLSPKFSPYIVTILPPTVGAFMGLISMMRGAGLDQLAAMNKLAKSSK